MTEARVEVLALESLVKMDRVPLFSTLIFHDFSMTKKKIKIHDLSAKHIFPSKWYTTYECIPELVVTVPSVRSTIVKKIKQIIIWLYKWSLCHFYRIAQCSSKYSMTLSSFSMTFPWLSLTFAIFHDFPGLENGLPKFHHFPWPGGTLNGVSHFQFRSHSEWRKGEA